MKRVAITLIVGLALTMGSLPGQAATKDCTYVAGVGLRFAVDRPTPPTCGGVGGVQFNEPGTSPSSWRIRITDAAGGKVAFSVCQTHGSQCGTEGSSSRFFCASSGSTVNISTIPGLVAGENLLVWVFVDEETQRLWSGSVPCRDAVATTGTVRLIH